MSKTEVSRSPELSLEHAQLVVSAVLAAIGLGTWALAFFGPFPPHPWVFLSFTVIAITCEIVATVMAVLNSGPRGDRSPWAFAVAALAVLPAVVAGIDAIATVARASSGI